MDPQARKVERDIVPHRVLGNSDCHRRDATRATVCKLGAADAGVGELPTRGWVTFHLSGSSAWGVATRPTGNQLLGNAPDLSHHLIEA